jgi:hypothetical protein
MYKKREKVKIVERPCGSAREKRQSHAEEGREMYQNGRRLKLLFQPGHRPSDSASGFLSEREGATA